MTKWFTAIAAVALATMSALSAANAQTKPTKVVEKFRDWVLYSHTGEHANICFLSSQPIETKPAGYERERSFFYVSGWPKDGVKAEVSVKLGKRLQNGSEVSVQIGRSVYALFTKDDKAFVREPARETELINAMKRGRAMSVRATAADGTEIEDVYSLYGITASIKRLERGCR